MSNPLRQAHRCRGCGKQWPWINMETYHGVLGLLRLLLRLPSLAWHHHVTCRGRRRGVIRCVTYQEAELMLAAGGWKLAVPEEDQNHSIGVVYLERIT